MLIAALVVTDTATTALTDEVGAPIAMTIDEIDDHNHDHDLFVTIVNNTQWTTTGCRASLALGKR